MPKYRVNRDKGHPVDSPRYAFGETFESNHVEDAAAVESGYLEVVSEPAPPKKEKRGGSRESDPLD